MKDESKRKKRSEKLSDSFAARLSREIGTGDRLEALGRDSRAQIAGRAPHGSELASMQTQRTHSFRQCQHCREYVPIREVCRGCGTPMD